MKKSIIVLLHIGFWFCYLILGMVLLGFLYGNDPDVADARIVRAMQVMFFFALLPAAITFYSYYFILFPKFLKQKKIGKLILFATLISLGAALVGYTGLVNVAGENWCAGEESEPMGTVVAFMAFIATISGIIALVIQGFITWFEEIKLKETLKQKNQEMELALVKAQLDPHFLFNTINNIDVLILKNPDDASDYLNKLSDIMRFMLYETKTEKIPLTKEIEYIKKYIDLQKIRTANTNYVKFNLDGKVNGQTIAPMLFIPFIENAFKHNNNKKLQNAIEIDIQVGKKKIQLICNNKFDVNRKLNGESNGLGNELIKKRLNLIYPEKHHLEITNEDNLYRVSLTVQHG